MFHLGLNSAGMFHHGTLRQDEHNLQDSDLEFIQLRTFVQVKNLVHPEILSITLECRAGRRFSFFDRAVVGGI